MGRTLKTIVQIIHGEEDAWKHFRRSLRKEDQAAFDLLWRFARKHAAAASMASRPIPFEAIVMSMLVGLARDLKEIQDEKKLDDLGKPSGD